MQVHLRGLPSTQKPVFDSKKRFFHIMVQVRPLKDLTVMYTC
jgi:hypothetical protein